MLFKELKEDEGNISRLELFSLKRKKEELSRKKGTTIPFNNGVLVKNSENLTLEPHHPEHYITPKLRVDYEPGASIENTPFKEFLT